jgi:carbamoyltransferase
MYILGINAYHGDAAAAIVRDGELIAAVEEERFNRIKHCAGFPAQSIQYCLRAAGIGIEEVDHAGISRDPSAHLHKKILMAARRVSRRGTEARRITAAVSRAYRLREPVDDSLLLSQTAQRDANGSSALSSMSDSASAGADPKAAVSGNGNGHGLRRQVIERLRNAAKVRDLKDELAKALGVSKSSLRAQFHNVEHHRAHLASSFYVSPFERAALLSLDGFGDFISTMWGVGEGNSIRVLGQVEYPHSLGIVYTATTQFLGFPHYGDEGKVMGLAPYGQPRFIEEFRKMIRTEKKGQFNLDLNYFRHTAEGVEMSWNDGSPRIGRIFSDEYQRAFGPAREPGMQLTDRESDLAASLQLRLEEVAFHVLNNLHDETGITDLGLSGGVAYNSVMNGKILIHTPFRRVFIQPAAGDSGTAVGVCYHVWGKFRVSSSESRERGEFRVSSFESRDKSLHTHQNSAPKESQLASKPWRELETRNPKLETYSAYTGPEFSDQEIGSELETVRNEGAEVYFEKHATAEITQRAASDIAAGLVVGWFQGRMEFGPRALGNRSILADPRRPEMKDTLNQRIKKREPFRPFAPAIMEEHVGDYFEQTHPAPTMLMVYQIKAERRRQIPAVSHVDGSGRLQTVSPETNPRFYELIKAFYKLTDVPVVLNTSFNENEPIVCTPRDALDCFLKTRMDVLYIGNYVVLKKEVATDAQRHVEDARN